MIEGAGDHLLAGLRVEINVVREDQGSYNIGFTATLPLRELEAFAGPYFARVLLAFLHAAVASQIDRAGAARRIARSSS